MKLYLTFVPTSSILFIVTFIIFHFSVFADAKIFELVNENNKQEEIQKSLQHPFLNPNYKNTDGKSLLMLFSEKGDLNSVKIVIQKGASLNLSDSNGWTALGYAISGKHIETVKFLLEQGANPNSGSMSEGPFDKLSPIIFAIHSGSLEISKLLMEKGAILDFKSYELNYALVRATDSGNKDLIEYLIKLGSDKGIKENLNEALWAACIKGNLELVKILLPYQIKDSDGKKLPLLIVATNSGNIELIKYLLNKGYNVNDFGYYSNTALMTAVQNKNIELVQFFLENGANVNAKNQVGNTALLNAVDSGNLDMVKLLLSKGASVNEMTTNKETSLSISINKNFKEITHLLIPKFKNFQNKFYGDTYLTLACKKGNADIIQKLIDYKVNLNEKNDSGKSALWIALESESNNEKIVQILLNASATFSEKDKNGKTILMLAAEKGYKNTISKLLKKGAKIDSRDKDKKTAIMYSIEKGDKQSVELFLKKGAKKEDKDSKGSTYLMKAASRKHKELVELLIDKGSKIDEVNKLGMTALMYAANNGYLEIVKLLIKNGADPSKEANHKTTNSIFSPDRNSEETSNLILGMKTEDKSLKTAFSLALNNGHKDTAYYLAKNTKFSEITDGQGRTLLMKACSRGFTDLAKILLKNNSKIDAIDKEKNTALIYATRNGHTETVKWLLDNGAKVDALTESGETALVISVYADFTEVAEALLNKGANPNIQFRNGWIESVLLPMAAKSGNLEMVRVLLKHGADVDLKKDYFGSSALVNASEYGFKEIVELLLKNGADVNGISMNRGSGKRETPLNVCKKKEIALILLNHGAKLKEGDETFFPYHIFLDEEMVEHAMNNNYDFDTLNSENETILIKAIRDSNLPVIQKLYQNPKTASQKFWTTPDSKNNSPMQVALEYSKPEILEILSKFNLIDLTKVNSDKQSLLHSTVQSGHYPYLETILKDKKEIQTFLNQSVNCSFYFRDIWESVEIQTPCTALGMGFANQGISKTTDLLESLGGKIHGGEILQLVANKDYTTMDHLISKKTKINWNHSYKGITSLMLAARNNDIRLAKYLLDKGADKTLKDDEGNNAVNWIIQTPATEMHELLKD